MKFIVNISEEVVLIKNSTIIPHDKQPIANEEILEWPEIKELLDQHKIEITEEN